MKRFWGYKNEEVLGLLNVKGFRIKELRIGKSFLEAYIKGQVSYIL